MNQQHSFDLIDKFLVAMPSLQDLHFQKAVVYICAHGPEGAMGLVVNRPLLDMSLSDVLQEMHIKPSQDLRLPTTVLFGGPLQTDRGFVIHRPVQSWQSTLAVGADVGVTSSQDILQAMAQDKGPEDALVALGYAGWAEGVIEDELAQNYWLVVPAYRRILFDTPFEERWENAIKTLGFGPEDLSKDVGHA